MGDLPALSDRLIEAGVRGLTIVWVDNNGITRSRTVPISRLAEVTRTGVGITTLFAVFDTHDANHIRTRGAVKRPPATSGCSRS